MVDAHPQPEPPAGWSAAPAAPAAAVIGSAPAPRWQSQPPLAGPDPAPPFSEPMALIRTPGESLRALGQVLPVRRLRPRQPAGQPWRHLLHQPPLDSLQLCATRLPPLSLQVDPRPHPQLTLLLLHAGTVRLRQLGTSWTVAAGATALLAAAPFVLISRQAHVLILSLDGASLLREGAALLGSERPPSRWQALLAAGDGRRLSALTDDPGLSTSLRHSLQLAHQLSALQASLPDRLQLDRLLHGLVALMLFPELRRRQPLERLTERRRQGRDAFDELLEQILDNLHQPLGLDWLVKTSNYSARTLQYKFRQRLDCTATDWIRSQRLDRARNLLQHAQPGDTVGAIATSCGYRSVNLFSIDFQQRFHVRPSDLLREAQRSGPLLNG
ncbi:MAG: helix-turn-helix transcriptional regulator [Cyanobacteriota bacterium]|nr:helix-turn-helix transcriptional regulator [Cyanobacteriota bacterium]